MNRLGFKNKLPRRGTRADVAMRKHALKSQRVRLPRARDLEELRLRAEGEMARSNAIRGVHPAGSPRGESL